MRERDEQAARQEEHGERTAHRDEGEGHAEVGDEHVLEHVHGLQVLLADAVDRADEREDGDRDAGEEHAAGSTAPGRRAALP